MKFVVLTLFTLAASWATAQNSSTYTEVYKGSEAGSFSSCSIKVIRSKANDQIKSVYVLSYIQFLEIPVWGDHESVLSGEASHGKSSDHKVVLTMSQGAPESFDYEGAYELAKSFPQQKRCVDLKLQQ